MRATRDRALPAWLIAFALALLSLGALAQPSDADQKRGRELAGEALKAYQEQRFDEALAKFEEAEKIYPAAQVLRMKGYTLLALERHLEALDLLERALKADFKPLTSKDIADTEQQRQGVIEKIVVLTIESEVEGTRVVIDDGEERPLPVTVRLEPGSHSFVARAEEHEPVHREQVLKPGEQKITLDPEPKAAPKPEPTVEVKPPPPPPPEEPSAGWFPYQREIGLAAGGVGLVAGVTALAVGIHGLTLRGAVEDNIAAHNQSYDASCSRNAALCYYDIQLINHDGERAAGEQNAALVTGLIGAGLFAAGTTLFLFAGDEPAAGAAPGKDEPGKDEPGKDEPREDEPLKDAGDAAACVPWLGLSSTAFAPSMGLGCAGVF